jgi:hypothetical protein
MLGRRAALLPAGEIRVYEPGITGSSIREANCPVLWTITRVSGHSSGFPGGASPGFSEKLG